MHLFTKGVTFKFLVTENKINEEFYMIFSTFVVQNHTNLNLYNVHVFKDIY